MHCDVPTLAQEVVLNFVEDLHRNVITIENYFSSILLFKDFLFKVIFAIRTMRINCIGLSTALVNITTFRRCRHGHLKQP